MIRRFLLLLVVLSGAPGCLVLSLQPAYDGDSLAWDPALLGVWRDADDNASVRIEAAEWHSYRLHYDYAIERGDLTGFLTVLGDARYLDVRPLSGEDPGSLLIPVHAVLRVAIDGDHLEVTPLSYDWLAARLRSGRPPGEGLKAVFDQKQNALIVSPTATLRGWLRSQPPGGAAFGAAASFVRVPPHPLSISTASAAKEPR
ncbi:MAG TPA: hypothetical protein VFX12_06205 [Vicinamibacterales bacterium]|nr:hypothetical protein [Vicinamibacterales bacterium]